MAVNLIGNIDINQTHIGESVNNTLRTTAGITEGIAEMSPAVGIGIGIGIMGIAIAFGLGAILAIIFVVLLSVKKMPTTLK